MLLAIDVGNSHTVLGVFNGARLTAEWRVTTSDLRTQDEIGLQLKAFLREYPIDPAAISAIGISSVVPPLTDIYEQMAKKNFRIDPIVVSGALDLGIRIHYDNPLAVGADRLCNAVAGFAKYGGPLVIVDYGTATTYDVVGTNGDYLGGVIAPGVETSAADLHRRAARLPRVELHLPSALVGRDTVSSMQAGILYGAIDSTVGMVQRLKEDLTRTQGRAPVIIGTGGFSAFIGTHARILDHIEPTLVLDGIRIIAERLGRT